MRRLHDSTAIFHVSVLEVQLPLLPIFMYKTLTNMPQTVARKDGTDSQSYRKAMAHVKETLAQLRSHPSTQEATIIFMPLASKHAKRTAGAYGSYRVPNNNIEARQAQAEEPLSMAHWPAGSPPVSHKPGLHNQQASQNSTKRKATLPICHSTKALCVNATDNCSGHGDCFKKYNTTSDDSEDNEDKGCWACSCYRNGTTINNRTTYWGGPACSKEDISAPFFLLAGLTIAMVAAISWGVGLMYSIGQEDLPSVIGAGVAGPSARK